MRPSDHSPNSGSDVALRTEVLELLTLGPSSFAAMYGWLVRGGAAPDVPGLFGRLRQLGERGVLQAFQFDSEGNHDSVPSAILEGLERRYEVWLGGLSAEQLTTAALAVDEVGLWYEITDAGRELAGASGETAWEVRLDGSLVVACAETIEMADSALASWLAHAPDVELDATTRMVREGTTGESPVQVEYRWRPRATASQRDRS